MYRKILVALDNSQTDQAMVAHISQLAKVHGWKLLLLHVADGWAARNYSRFQWADSEEMKEDRAYLDRVAADFQKEKPRGGNAARTGRTGQGNFEDGPEEACDLIAMTPHGHRFLKDLLYGSTTTQVRHRAPSRSSS